MVVVLAHCPWRLVIACNKRRRLAAAVQTLGVLAFEGGRGEIAWVCQAFEGDVESQGAAHISITDGDAFEDSSSS